MSAKVWVVDVSAGSVGNRPEDAPPEALLGGLLGRLIGGFVDVLVARLPDGLVTEILNELMLRMLGGLMTRLLGGLVARLLGGLMARPLDGPIGRLLKRLVWTLLKVGETELREDEEGLAGKLICDVDTVMQPERNEGAMRRAEGEG